MKDFRWLNGLSDSTRKILTGALDSYLKTDQLQDYRAYPKQLLFHIAGRYRRNRLLKAGNQNGKTFSAGAEVAMHLTGEYPDHWLGHRYPAPIVCWASGETAESTRDNPQRVLLGRPREVGTGMIPERCLTGIYGRSGGIADAYEFYMVRHVTGGLSMLKFRNYAQKREAWQGPPVNLVWFDEEPPWMIYQEGLARTIAVQGRTIMTFTPLQGYSEVVNLYLKDPEPEEKSRRHTTSMTIYDAHHLTDEERDSEIRSWPAHERRARIYGEPALGSGTIYPFARETIEVPPFSIPEHFRLLGCIDFGGSTESAHPTGAVLLAHDVEGDVVYVVREYREKAKLPAEHWIRLRNWGRSIKWAWPRDGVQSEKSTGSQIADMFRSEGMVTLPTYAQFKGERRKTRGQSGHAPMQSVLSVERGILEIHDRMEHGRFRVFANCNLWFEEMRTYHRKATPSGKLEIVKKNDDLMDATRYGIMMLRFAHTGKKKVHEDKDDPHWEVGF
ncbi:terminase large subunit domain-containing protein [Candidatus Poriferisocius sp.]|uniref:terminase large subunit domain-containing protein n=1 Tax=Candidatus Poriferisocius sp. TaxID=3101276 RepID=UPI003B013009